MEFVPLFTPLLQGNWILTYEASQQPLHQQNQHAWQKSQSFHSASHYQRKTVEQLLLPLLGIYITNQRKPCKIPMLTFKTGSRQPKTI